MLKLEEFDYQVAADAGVEVELTHPVSGAPLSAWITVHGRDSRRYRDKSLELKRRRMEWSSRPGAAAGDAVERVEREALELLVACTSAWRGVEQGGAALPFSAENASQFYARYECFRDQVDAAIHTRALFSPTAGTS